MEVFFFVTLELVSNTPTFFTGERLMNKMIVNFPTYSSIAIVVRWHWIWQAAHRVHVHLIGHRFERVNYGLV